MACFFCDSIFHISHNCCIYISNKDRERRAYLKNCCYKCLSPLIKLPCPNCESTRKCYLCFSKTHHTVYCQHRDEEWTIPNIDNDLLLRFMKMLKRKEKYFLAVNNPVLFNSGKLEPFKAAFRKIQIFTHINYVFPGMDFIAIEDGIYFEQFGIEPLDISISVSLPLFHVESLRISRSKFFVQELIPLLSPKTEILRFGYTTFYPNISLCEILERAPKLEGIDIYASNVEVGNTWPEDILQLCRSYTLKYLYLNIPSFDFNIESLVTLIKKKGDDQFHVNLYISLPWNNYFNAKASIKNKIKKQFLSKKESPRPCLKIMFSSFIQHGCPNYNEYEEYVLKNVC